MLYREIEVLYKKVYNSSLLFSYSPYDLKLIVYLWIVKLQPFDNPLFPYVSFEDAC